MNNSLKIVIPGKSYLSKVVAGKLAEYLHQVAGGDYPILEDDDNIPSSGTLVIIGNAERNRAAKHAGFQQDWSAMRPDGYVIRTVRDNRGIFVIAAGKTEAGDKYAVYRLIREIEVHGHSFSLGDYHIVMNPFIKIREVIMGNAVPWDPFFYADQVPEEDRGITPDILYDTPSCQLNFPDGDQSAGRAKVAHRRILAKYCIENWPRLKLLEYVEQMDAFGFNSIQYCDEYEPYMHSGCLVSRRQWRNKLLDMMRRTRSIGNYVSFLMWGGVAFRMAGKVISDWDDPLVDAPVAFPRERHHQRAACCWNNARERQEMQAHMTYLSGYAPFIDHLVSHFVDPGGCGKNGCTISTAMAIMNHQYQLFLKKNPALRGTFNVWPLTSDYSGYRVTDTFGLKSYESWGGTYSWWYFTKAIGKLDPSIMVASRKYNPVVAEQCRQWNRRYGIWSWYNCDQETTASLHVEAERLGREFAELPREAAEAIEYYAVPNNCHGLNSASLYIAAGLLWEPYRDPFQLLKEFCYSVFGPNIFEAVYTAYSAIARIRNHDFNGDSAFSNTYLGAGTDDPERDAQMSGHALAIIETVTVDAMWVSKIPMAVEREEILEDLKDHLRMVQQYALFRSRFLKLAQQERIYPEDLVKLPKVEKMRVSGGMIEWRKVQALLRALRK